MLAQEQTLRKLVSCVFTVAFKFLVALRYCAKITQYAQKGMILYKIGLDQHKDFK